nr:type VI secretion system protein TssA [uncultured Tolumonas sp.]
MTQSNAGIVKTLVAPVVGHILPQGEDIRYDPDFEKIETEIAKLTSLHKNQQTDWKLVQKLSYQLLINNSKDLRLTCWYSAALLKNEGYVRLVNVYELLAELFSHYGQCCFPLKPRARLAALNWLFERIDFNMDGFVEKQANDTIEQLINVLMACDTALNEQFGEDAPFLMPKIQQLRDIQRRQQQEKPFELALAAIPSVPPANPLAVMAPAVSTITEDSDSVRIARYLQEQSQLLIPYLLQKDLADPRAYLLTRSCAWLQISTIPAANEQKITSLKPLTVNKLQEYQKRLAAKEFAALIPDLEMSLSKAPFWFDGHYWCAQVLQALGHSAMAEYVRHYLSSFLLKFPEIVALRFDDGSPFMSTETEAWLFASTTEQQLGANSSDDHTAHTTEHPWLCALKTAQENVRQNSKLLKQEMRGLQILANAAGSEREKVCWQLALVKFAQQYQRHDLATLILEDIYQLVCQFKLKDWEPHLFKEILQLWQCSLEKINSKQYQDKINEIKNNLYRLDISMAF